MSTVAPTTAAERLVISLYRLSTVQRALGREAFAELGSQGFLALAVLRLRGPARVSEIARRLHTDLSVASRQAAALVEAGYAAREPDPDDRRAHRLSITPAGEAAMAESHRRMVAEFEDALAGWREQDIAALAEGLERLRDDFTEEDA
jgi:DNA-binding MarR family transcriptional regulator